MSKRNELKGFKVEETVLLGDLTVVIDSFPSRRTALVTLMLGEKMVVQLNELKKQDAS